jgi:hypothetical protein
MPPETKQVEHFYFSSTFNQTKDPNISLKLFLSTLFYSKHYFKLTSKTTRMEIERKNKIILSQPQIKKKYLDKKKNTHHFIFLCECKFCDHKIFFGKWKISPHLKHAIIIPL